MVYMSTPRIYLNARKPWSSEEEKHLKDLVALGKYSYPELTAFFPGRSAASLSCRARQYLDIHSSYRQHKYEYDTEFFKTPNPINSYIAGFLAADGSIRLSDKQSPVLTLSLSKKDLSHLTHIKEILGYTGVIYDHTHQVRTQTLVKGALGMMTFQMSVSEDYIKHLADNFGVTPRKTKRLQPPNLSYENQLAYLIGLIDGDGFTNIATNRSDVSVGFISSSEEAAKWIKSFVDGLNLPRMRQKEVNIGTRHEGRAFTMRYQGAQAVALIKLIQSFARARNIPLLERKWFSDKVNQRIAEFEARHPDFIYHPPDFPPIPV